MDQKDSFRVLIVGGSVAGLSLANMLEARGVNFLLLEAYDTIAPQIGASIGLLGNGLRILHQLGCYDELRRHAPDCLTTSRSTTPRRVIRHENLDELLIERFGYPFVFMDRQTLLQVLYDNLKDKSRVLTAKRVVEVRSNDNSVEVFVSDGSTYSGHMVVGADGIHSKVRSEMWKIARQVEPNYIPADEEKKIACHYACIFGISSATGRWKGGDVSNIFGNKYSFFIVGGPKDCVYWFLFVRLPEPKYGRDIPRFTVKDEKEIVAKYWTHQLDGITFGDLYLNRRTSVLTALQEVVFTKWGFQRIMTIGDAAHKLHPLGAQGGNSAIESAAELTNRLCRALHRSKKPSPVALQKVFEDTQKVRASRTLELKDLAHARQRIEALDGVLMRLFADWVLPNLDKEIIFDRFHLATSPASKLEGLLTPYVPRTAPFDDELPARPRKPGKALGMFYGILIFLAILGTNGASKTSISCSIGAPVASDDSGHSIQNDEIWMRHIYLSSILLPVISFSMLLQQGKIPFVELIAWSMMIITRKTHISVIAPILYASSVQKFSKARNFLSFRRQKDVGRLRTTMPALLITGILVTFTAKNSNLGTGQLYQAWSMTAYLLQRGLSVTFRGPDAEARLQPLTYERSFLVLFILTTSLYYLAIAKSGFFLLANSLAHFNSDLSLFSAETLAWLMAHGWLFSQSGFSTTKAPHLLVVVPIISLLVGPGATASLLFYWQEVTLKRGYASLNVAP